MTPTPPLQMQSGESRLLRLPAGTCLHLHGGRLALLEMPGWLDGPVTTPPLVLLAGEVHVAPRDAWLRLDAQAACRLGWRCPAPAPPRPRAATAARQALLARCRAALARLHRRTA